MNTSLLPFNSSDIQLRRKISAKMAGGPYLVLCHKAPYSGRESFFWLKDAALLDIAKLVFESLKELEPDQTQKFLAGETPDGLAAKLHELNGKKSAEKMLKTIAMHPSNIRDYFRVQQSRARAWSLLMLLQCQGYSIADLDMMVKVKKTVHNHQKMLLHHAKATGNIKDSFAFPVISKAAKDSDAGFFIKLGKALDPKLWGRVKMRPPLIDYERIGPVARFLIEYWCGDGRYPYETRVKLFKMLNIATWRGDEGGFILNQTPNFFFMPPLCFFSPKALAMFCAVVLQMKQSDKAVSVSAISKHISRFRLRRAAAPTIKEVKHEDDGIYFRF